MSEARRNEEIISLADSQTLRWLDSMNRIFDADDTARRIKADIRRLRNEPSSLQNRRQIRRLYEQLDGIQFKPDYLCVIMDREKDYIRACQGFSVNGVEYHRLLGTNGGVKNETIVFASDRHGCELRRRIENGRNPEKELVPAKLEAYKALTCSASIPVSMPRGVLVVNDCETEFVSDIVYLSDEQDGEPVMEERNGATVQLTESDGYGMMLPSLAERWAQELDIDYLPAGVNTRFAWEKGMAFTFDFVEFAREVAGQYVVKDAWGHEVDIREVELVLTTSMVKLWDSYDSCEDYLRCSVENGYQFGITKVCPKSLESEHCLNYQFIQSYELSDEDVDELIAPTMDEISDILYADYHKTILFLKGFGLNDKNVDRLEADYAKALMVEPAMMDDPYIQSKVFRLIKNRINEAKVGVIKVHGNYSIVSGDPYSLCQSIFGLPVTGLLGAGEVYNKYWLDAGVPTVACFRAPMSCHNNIGKMSVSHSPAAEHWYQYMNTCTVFNSWDTTAHALNGMDKDGDLVMLTDNRVLVDNQKQLPALMCVQRKAKKKVPTEGDFIRCNIDSFGDDIGKITNRVTSMFEVQSRFHKGSEPYKELDYRIKCGQLFQQNAIDRAKGIISKPMPREWYDRHHAAIIGDAAKRRLYLAILADKKPYFMRYIYPDLMKQYNTYIKNADKKALREFGMPVEELMAKEPWELSRRQRDFLRYYRHRMPVGTGDCVTNRICRRFELEFDGYVGKRSGDTVFDYTIMKSGADYTRTQYNAIHRLYDDYNLRLREYAVFANRERVDGDEAASHMYMMRQEFRTACDGVCSNASCLCDILLDICYRKNNTKNFVWDMCGEEIVKNLLQKNNGLIHYPTLDPEGDIVFCGRRFSFHSVRVPADIEEEIGVSE